MSYIISRMFHKIQAVATVGTRFGDPVDPVAIEVVLTSGTDNLDHRIEQFQTPCDTKRLWRVRNGQWAFQLEPSLLQPGRPYTLRWRYQMTPGNINVAHDSFIWQPVPELPREPDKTIIYGLMVDVLGMPMSGQRLVMETYRDFSTLMFRVGQAELVSDVFGHWFVEVPKGRLFRFVANEISQIVQSSRAKARTSLSELPSFQPKDVVRRDRFGYPAPGVDLLKLLAAQLNNKQALALLSSTAMVRIDGGPGPSDENLEIITYVQGTPETIWNVQHNKDCLPIVSVLDENDEVVLPDIQIPDRNTVVIIFGAPTRGTAILVCGRETQL
jgi:hypothetical protein